jgi:hypothetical protein
MVTFPSMMDQEIASVITRAGSHHEALPHNLIMKARRNVMGAIIAITNQNERAEMAMCYCDIIGILARLWPPRSSRCSRERDNGQATDPYSTTRAVYWKQHRQAAEDARVISSRELWRSNPHAGKMPGEPPHH